MHSFRLLNEIYLSHYMSLLDWIFLRNFVALHSTTIFKKCFKNDWRVCFNERGITILSLPIKVYARVLERRVRALVELRIQEKQCGFHPGCGTLDQFFTLSGILEDAWELTCALWTWRRHLTMFLGVCCGTCLGNMPLQ